MYIPFPLLRVGVDIGGHQGLRLFGSERLGFSEGVEANHCRGYLAIFTMARVREGQAIQVGASLS